MDENKPYDSNREKSKAVQELLREERAFFSMQKDLQSDYPNAYVAIQNGTVIASGKDEFKLAAQMAKEHPRKTMLIRSVDYRPPSSPLETWMPSTSQG